MTSPLSTASVLCIGTELTRGEIDNTNATWIAERLTELGLSVRAIESVPDDASAIGEALERASGRSALLAVTGGLGPTTDDITSASAAAWAGVPQVRNADVIHGLEEYLTRLGRPLTASNAQQADFPMGAEILDNPHGTAPGFSLSRQGCACFFMPGVPREMKPMFERYVAPVAQALAQGGQCQVRLRCFGVPESQLNDRLSGLEALHGVAVGYRAHFPEVHVKLVATAPTRAEAETRAFHAREEARVRLGSSIYAEEEEDMPLAVARLMRRHSLTLALAESCTGGLVSTLLTQNPASDFLLGGIVSYANQVKIDHLGVEPEALAMHGAVSPIVARQMAEGARTRFKADFGLSLTGIAGPTGATDTKPVGLVYYALSTAEGTLVRDVNVRHRSRDGVQLYAAWCALNLVRENLLARSTDARESPTRSVPGPE